MKNVTPTRPDPPIGVAIIKLIHLVWLIWLDHRQCKKELAELEKEGLILDIIGRSAVRQGRYLAAKEIYKDRPEMRHDWMREACGAPMDKVFRR